MSNCYNLCPFLLLCRKYPSCSLSLSAQAPAQGTCPAWPASPTSRVAGVRLCPAACCGTAQTSSCVPKGRRETARGRASAICCSHPSTAPCVKSTETAQRALRYIGARQRFYQGFAICCCVPGTDEYCNLTLRTRIASGRSTPVRRVTTSAVDEGDWMDRYETQLDVPKCATSGLKLICAQPLEYHVFQRPFYQHIFSSSFSRWPKEEDLR